MTPQLFTCYFFCVLALVAAILLPWPVNLVGAALLTIAALNTLLNDPPPST